MPGDTSNLQRSTLDLIAWIAERPPYEDPSGFAGGHLHRDAVAAGKYDGCLSAFNGLLRRLEQRRLIERTIRGKRTYRVAVLDPPPKLVPVPDLPPEPAPEPTPPPAATDADDLEAGIDVEARDVDEVAASAPLAATVHLALDVDPVMARLILDLVEHGQGVRPVDRDTVERMIERRVNQATSRSAAGMTRVLERIDTVEANIAGVANAMRGLGIEPATVIRDRPTRVTKPDFRHLGVKDSQQRRLLTDLAIDGWTFDKANGGHVKATKDGHKPLLLSCTPSDHRTPLNERARARQAGAAV